MCSFCFCPSHQCTVTPHVPRQVSINSPQPIPGRTLGMRQSSRQCSEAVNVGVGKKYVSIYSMSIYIYIYSMYIKTYIPIIIYIYLYDIFPTAWRDFLHEGYLKYWLRNMMIFQSLLSEGICHPWHGAKLKYWVGSSCEDNLHKKFESEPIIVSIWLEFYKLGVKLCPTHSAYHTL